MDQNTIDTISNIGKKLVPNSDVTNIWWWIAIGFAAIVGLFWYVFRKWVTDKILSILPRPRVFLLDNEKRVTKICLPRCLNSDTNTLFAERLKSSMDKIRKEHPLINMDAYINMNLCIPGQYHAAQCYNEDISEYYNSMQMYYQNTIADEVTSSYMIPLNFVLYANTRRTCNKLHITLTQTAGPSLFPFGSKKLVVSKRYVPPVYDDYKEAGEFNGFFANDTEEYSYYEWNLKSSAKVYSYQKETLVSGINDTETIAPLYVDTHNEATYKFDWKINGEDIPAKGITGCLIVEVK